MSNRICAGCKSRFAPSAAGGNGLCRDCYDAAGDANAVSDGDMTCATYVARWGEHPWSCTCKPEAPAPVSVFTLEVRRDGQDWTSTGDNGDYDAVVATARRFKAVGWDVQIVKRVVVLTGADLDEDAPAVLNPDGTPTAFTLAMFGR